MTATVTTDFREEYETERARWLRKRFLWWSGVIIALDAVNVAGSLIALALRRVNAPREAVLVGSAFTTAQLAIHIWGFLYVRQRLPLRQTIVRLVFWLIVVIGVLSLSQQVAVFEMGSPVVNAGVGGAPTARITATGEAGAPSPNLIVIGAFSSVFLSHFLACLFLPLTPRESVKPILPLLALAAGVTLVYARGVATPALVIALSPAIAAPGAAVCWWRHGRFRSRFHFTMLRQRYGEMKRELVDARRIHEALFPAPIRQGEVRFDYRYEPMRQIGGDFLFAHRFSGLLDDVESPPEPLSIVIIDVTGHGIPAALTVNRLHGELERLFAEDPDIGPGETLASLNRYVHLTLANHSVYATALCLRADPAAQALVYASGGHPPAFIRTVDGRLERLDSTAFVLGACADDDFDAGERRARFGLGDCVIAYTDGAIEARDERGVMLGVEGIQRIVLGARPDPGPEGGLAPAILRQVSARRAGPLMDDTLIVEMYRPLRA